MNTGLIAVGQAQAFEYAIEFHSAGVEERVGLAKVLSENNRHAPNPITGQTFLGNLLAINSTFNGIATAEPEVLVRLVTPDFFQENLFDHLWKIYRVGRGGLDRSIIIKERFLAHIQNTALVRYYKKKEGFWLFKKNRTYKKVWDHEVRQQIAGIFFDDYEHPGSKVTSFQEWLINEEGYEGEEVVFFDSYLRQESPFTSYPWPEGELPYFRNRWDTPMIILTPFAHSQYSRTPSLDTGDRIDKGTEENYLFPMDWQQACLSRGESTAVSIMISGELLHIYEMDKTVLKKKDEPSVLQRYDFVPATGSMKLTIWGLPGEFEPWAWEYREKISSGRAVRYLRIVAKEKDRSGEQQAVDVPVKTRKKVTFQPPGPPPPDHPDDKVTGLTMVCEGYAETQLANTISVLFWLLLARNDCCFGRGRNALSF